MYNQENFGRQLCKIRKKDCGLTQKQFAQKLGLCETHVRNIEKGRHDITLSTFLKIVCFLGLDASVLLKEPTTTLACPQELFHTRLKRLRLQKGLKIEDLMYGIEGVPGVSDYRILENGKGNPRLSSIDKISRMFHVEIADLIHNIIPYE